MPRMRITIEVETASFKNMGERNRFNKKVLEVAQAAFPTIGKQELVFVSTEDMSGHAICLGEDGMPTNAVRY